MGKSPIEILRFGKDWVRNLYAQSIHEQASQNLYLLELAMLTHQPGDRQSASKMSTRVRKIADGLEAMLIGASTVSDKNPTEGRLTMSN